MSRVPPSRRRGTVRDFDAAAGYGTIAAADGDDAWFFHCTAVADGTRSIDEGADVNFVLTAGRAGRWEATDIHPA